MCPDYYNVNTYRKTAGHAKVGPKYKPAKGDSGKGTFNNRGRTKPATHKKLNVDKKVKKISNKVMKLKTPNNPGPAAHSRYGGNNA